MTTLATPALTADEARRLTERIRLNVVNIKDGVERLQGLLVEAKEGQAHAALGYPSWPAYIADVMGDEPLRLSRDDRREIVGYLTGEGMSTRAIGSVLGVSHQQVKRDRDSGVTNVTPEPPLPPESADVPFDAEIVEDEDPDLDDQLADLNRRHAPEPQPVTGLDGKTYTRPAPSPEPVEPPKTRRRPLPDAIRDTTYDIEKRVESLGRLVTDDRFPANKKQVAPRLRNDLLRIQDLLHQVLDTLNEGKSTDEH